MSTNPISPNPQGANPANEPMPSTQGAKGAAEPAAFTYAHTRLQFTGKIQSGMRELIDPASNKRFLLDESGSAPMLIDAQSGYHVKQDSDGNPLYDASGEVILIRMIELIGSSEQLAQFLKNFIRMLNEKPTDEVSINLARERIELKSDAERKQIEALEKREQVKIQEHLRVIEEFLKKHFGDGIFKS